MGCSIRLYAEIKKDGAWEKLGHIFKSRYPGYTDSPYEGQNYDLFALLAGVRNTMKIKPLSNPKGLPNDVSAEVEAISDRCGTDGYSHSYFNVEELLNVNSEYIFKGFVSEEQFKIFNLTGSPNVWQYNIFGARVKIIHFSDMQSYVDGVMLNDKQFDYYTEIEWIVSYKDICGHFKNTIEQLSLLNRFSDSEIRIVFWFN